MMSIRSQVQNKIKDSMGKNASMKVNWCPHHDSNVEHFLRTELFYPLNYGGQ